MKHIYFLFFLVSTLASGQLDPPAELQAYYGDVFDETDATQLYDDLAVHTIAKHTNILSYSDRHDYLYDADEDLSNSSNVILVYSGESRSETEYLSGNNPNTPQTFNTEHVYPQSLIGNTAKGDLHHLRSCDTSINGDRGNMPFGTGSGTYADLGSSWYPGDEWIGDVARMVMYLNLRYDEPFTDVGTLNLFLQWNADDPVSDFEINRNSVITGVQGDRNPFIDNPYIATVLWGGPAAENRWEALSVNEVDTDPIKIYPNPIKGNILYIDVKSEATIEIFNVLGKRVINTKLGNPSFYLDISTLNRGVYLVKVKTDSGSITKKLIRQ